MDTETTHISLIIPAFNEAEGIPETLKAIIKHVDSLASRVEVIVVDDGSTDGTVAVVREFMEQRPYIKLIQNPHKGKGHTVKTGILAGKGEYLMMLDADLSTPIDVAWRLLPRLDQEYYIGIGSRAAPGAERKGEPFLRHFLGIGYNRLIKIILSLNINDTQCGFKCFARKAARSLFQQQTITGWGFDIEILFLAQKSGYKILEIPVVWNYGHNSRINVIRDTLNMFVDLLRVRWNDFTGKYNNTLPTNNNNG